RPLENGGGHQRRDRRPARVFRPDRRLPARPHPEPPSGRNAPMNGTAHWSDRESLSVAHLGRLVALCDRFESVWRGGGRPRAEDFVAQEPAGDRPQFLRRLLAVEIDVRPRLGELPGRDEFLTRFPGCDALVADALRATPG